MDKYLKSLIGKKYLPPLSLEIHSEYGPVITQKSTNNKLWFAFFKSGEFYMEVDKKTDKILNIKFK